MSVERNNGHHARGSILADGLTKADLWETATSQRRKSAPVQEAMSEVLAQAYSAEQLDLLDLDEAEWDAFWLEFQELFQIPTEEDFESILYTNYRLVTVWFDLYETR